MLLESTFRKNFDQSKSPRVRSWKNAWIRRARHKCSVMHSDRELNFTGAESIFGCTVYLTCIVLRMTMSCTWRQVCTGLLSTENKTLLQRTMSANLYICMATGVQMRLRICHILCVSVSQCVAEDHDTARTQTSAYASNDAQCHENLASIIGSLVISHPVAKLDDATGHPTPCCRAARLMIQMPLVSTLTFYLWMHAGVEALLRHWHSLLADKFLRHLLERVTMDVDVN